MHTPPLVFPERVYRPSLKRQRRAWRLQLQAETHKEKQKKYYKSSLINRYINQEHAPSSSVDFFLGPLPRQAIKII